MSTRFRRHRVVGTLAVILALLVTPLLASGSRSQSGTRGRVRSSSTASTRSRSGSVTRAHAPRTSRGSASNRAVKPRSQTSKRTLQAKTSRTSSSGTRDARQRILRSEMAKRTFMRQTGYPHGAPGMS